MKLFIVLIALCALAACVVEASPRHWLRYRQLQNQQQQAGNQQQPMQLIQKRMWTKTKSKSKWTAMRRQSEEGQIGKRISNSNQQMQLPTENKTKYASDLQTTSTSSTPAPTKFRRTWLPPSSS